MEILKLYDHTTNTWKAVPALKGEDGDPGMVSELLWTNQSPTADFSPQTLSVDVSPYASIRIVYKQAKTDSAVFDSEIIVDSFTHCVDSLTMPASGTTVAYRRTVAFTNNNIVFGAGMAKIVPDGVRGTFNDVIIPVKIYGLFQPTSPGNILDIVYPVGSIYTSVNNVSPQLFLGGTWEQIQDTFLLAAGTNHAAGTTGGAETVTLTTDQIPSHAHNLPYNTDALNSTGSAYYAHTSGQGSWYFAQVMNKTNNTGGGQAHNNMPPYLTVYMWKRTA